MAYTFKMKEGSGTLFKNDNKEMADHPDYRGSCMIGGEEHWLNAWIKDGKKGKYMSLSIRPKNMQSNGSKGYEPRKYARDDDIPF